MAQTNISARLLRFPKQAGGFIVRQSVMLAFGLLFFALLQTVRVSTALLNDTGLHGYYYQIGCCGSPNKTQYFAVWQVFVQAAISAALGIGILLLNAWKRKSVL